MGLPPGLLLSFVKLRSHLFILALGTIVPVAIFAVIIAAWLVDRERDALREGAERRAFALSTAVDAELRGHFATLDALASVPSLQDANLGYFRDVAENALKSQPDWLNLRLATSEGRFVLDLRGVGASASPDALAANDSFLRAARAGKSAISDVTWDPHLQQWRFTILAPVLSTGTIRYVIAADIKPESIKSILQAQRLEEGQIGAVLDSSNRMVARTRDGEKYIGQPASESLRTALAQKSSGWFRGQTVEGIDVYSPFHRSEATGWTVALGLPTQAVDLAAWRSSWTLLLGMILSIALALFGASLINRRITQPITALASATESIGKGRETEIPTDAKVDEIRTLAHALRASSEAAQERQALIEREKTALQEADRAKDRFLAMLSHELRNPLAAISAAAHVIRFAKAGSAESIKGQLVVERQTRHMAHLVGDLLDVSRITLGKMALEREPLDMAEAVAKLLSSWRASGRFERHIVTLDAESAWVHADRTRVEQIAANLVDNALKFTPHDRRVTVYVGREGNQAVLCVTDTGPGIPPHLLDHLFEPFVQANEPGARASAGLGIGLALVKGLAEMHGGSVSASNTAAGGAMFTVRVPLYEGRSLEARMERVAAGGRNILLIEDDDDTRTMLHAALEFSGHEVREARDGTSGLALAAESLPDVAVIDLGLPDIDGLEVARRLRSTQGKRRLALVALTGFGGPADQRRALDAGFDVHLTKPVTHDRLKRVIGDLR